MMKQHKQRQDHYARQARDQGYRSRSVFKLKEIQAAHGLIKPGMTVLELGGAPGGWTQVITKWVTSSGRVVVCDRLAMQPVKGAVIVQGDFCEDETIEQLQSLLEQGANVVVSDMAPHLTGDAFQDQVMMLNLVEAIVASLPNFLQPNGHLLCKVFHGGEFESMRRSIANSFKKVSMIKPNASRSKSNEVYILARGFKMC